jgi:eukaryotic-like serine/threonine-protein kinase
MTMSLSPGTTLGSYEVSGLLGKGGMGEVYRARDTRLGREVAIKTLPPEFASDPDRLARFEREARALAAFNHPNIAGIHGLEESGGVRFLVLELVEGETLGERLKGRHLTLEQALRIALQIAGALEAAHAKGIIHRDLKPANIKVTPDGTVKVLDFGLAKAFEPDASPADLANSPTLSMAATARGVILGTAGYMSPQQARGEPVDKQADIWAFGCVLFELLAGRQIWSGRTVADVMAAVLARDPDWSRLPPGLHPRLRFVLERCLEKETADRYRDIADARVEISKVLVDPAGMTVKDVAPAAKRSRPLAVAAAAIAGMIVTGAVAWYLWPQAEPRPLARFNMDVPELQTPGAPGAGFPDFPLLAVSRDGTRWAVSSGTQLYLRNIGEADARPIDGADSSVVFSPTFSPDGQWLAYVTFSRLGSDAGLIRKIPISGGTPQTVATLTGVVNAATAFNVDLAWDDRNMLTWARPQGIMQVSADGGEPTLAVRASEGEALASPQVLPGGDAILFTSLPSTGAVRWDTAQVVVQPIGSDDRKVVWRGGRDARYVPTGHLLYAQGTTLFGVPFDVGRREVTGSQTPMVEGLRAFPGAANTDTAQYAVSDAGVLVFLTGGAPPLAPSGGGPAPRSLAWVSRTGQETPLRVRADDYTMVRISPDGTKAALVVGNALGTERPTDIWIYDLASENLRQLTFDAKDDDGPVWTSGSDRLIFRSFRDGDETHGGVYSVPADGGTPERIAMSADFPFALPWSISPDDRTLALVNARTATEIDIATLDTGGKGTFALLLDSAPAENEPAIAPNGQWMAYEQGSGDIEINIRPFPDVARQRFPVGTGIHPVFSRDGSELFYFDGKGISAASVAYKPAFRIGAPQSLFQGRYWYGAGGPQGALGRSWDVDRNGQRFLMIRMPSAPQAPSSETKAPPPPPVRLNVVLNWLDELKRRSLSR